jgi:hypothetical protein
LKADDDVVSLAKRADAAVQNCLAPSTLAATAG